VPDRQIFACISKYWKTQRGVVLEERRKKEKRKKEKRKKEKRKKNPETNFTVSLCILIH
jgi:hypothetical protein